MDELLNAEFKEAFDEFDKVVASSARTRTSWKLFFLVQSSSVSPTHFLSEANPFCYLFRHASVSST